MMVLLKAAHLDIFGRCQFSIEASGAVQTTKDAVKAAKILSRLGVNDPLGLVEHARNWGSVEIEAPTGTRQGAVTTR